MNHDRLSLRKTAGALAMAATAAGIFAPAAQALEPGAAHATPNAATVGLPAGANPPPGTYFGAGLSYVTGHIADADGDPAGVEARASSLAISLHHVPGNTFLGGTYRAFVVMPVVKVDVDAFGATSDVVGLADITVSPVNLSWTVRPDVFVSAGLAFGVPTGSFDPTGATISTGANVLTTSFSAGASYLRDGWNLSALAIYSTHGRNPDTRYKSGDDLMVDWTAMKRVGNADLGLVGYGRWEMTGDENAGSFHGAATSQKSREVGVGFGYSRQLGNGTISAYYIRDIVARNALKGDLFKLSYAIPFGA